jgi:hypothetical protein
MPRFSQSFLEPEGYAKVRELRKSGKLDQAETILLRSDPVPAVLDELRKIASTRARSAKKKGDWESVFNYLQGYSDYAGKSRAQSITMANQEPPEHTDTDAQLLLEAKSKIGKSE